MKKRIMSDREFNILLEATTNQVRATPQNKKAITKIVDEMWDIVKKRHPEEVIKSKK